MKAIVVKKYTDDYSGLEIKDVPKPVLQKGELLIKVEESLVSPSDISFINNDYLVKREVPIRPGFFGLGTVIENKAGLLGASMKGKKVWFSPGNERDGAWAEFAVSDINGCIPYEGKLTKEQALALPNAITVVEMIHKAKKHKAKALVLNAAASSIGILVNIYAKQKGIEVINVVRSDTHFKKLKNVGATHILNEESECYTRELERLTKQLNATVFYDSVSGTSASTIMNLLPYEAITYTIGNLSKLDIPVNVMDLLMIKRLTLKAFIIGDVLDRKNILGKLSTIAKAQKLLRKSPGEVIGKTISFEAAVNDFRVITENRTDGKLLLKP